LFKRDKKSQKQAVLVHLDAVGLSDETYANYDLSTLEDQLIAVLSKSGCGECDGNEIGGGEAVLYMYGPDADALFLAIEPVLKSNPLCHGARVTIRSGPPGAKEREVKI